MAPHSLIGAYADDESHILWENGERVFRRGWRADDDGNRKAVLIVLPGADQPSRLSLDRLTHEYELKDELDGAWAARPLELVRDAGRTMLVLEDAGGRPIGERNGHNPRRRRFNNCFAFGDTRHCSPARKSPLFLTLRPPKLSRRGPE